MNATTVNEKLPFYDIFAFKIKMYSDILHDLQQQQQQKCTDSYNFKKIFATFKCKRKILSLNSYIVTTDHMIDFIAINLTKAISVKSNWIEFGYVSRNVQCNTKSSSLNKNNNLVHFICGKVEGQHIRMTQHSIDTYLSPFQFQTCANSCAKKVQCIWV